MLKTPAVHYFRMATPLYKKNQHFVRCITWASVLFPLKARRGTSFTWGLSTTKYKHKIWRKIINEPVAANAVDCVALNLWAGLDKSPIPANTRHHLKAGAQKKTVLGPAGLSQSGFIRFGTNLSNLVTVLQYKDIMENQTATKTIELH